MTLKMFIKILLSFCFLLVSATNVIAETQSNNVIEVYKNNSKIHFKNIPFIENNDVYLPLRETLSLFEINNITWDNGNITIDMSKKNISNQISGRKPIDDFCSFNINTTTIIFKPSNTYYYLRSIPILRNGVTYISSDFFANMISEKHLEGITINVVQSTNPNDYHINNEDIFIGTAKQNDEAEWKELKKRIVVNEENKVIAIIPVENQNKQLIEEKLSSTAPKLHIYSLNDIKNICLSVVDSKGYNVEISADVFIHLNDTIVAYLSPVNVINKPLIDFANNSDLTIKFGQ